MLEKDLEASLQTFRFMLHFTFKLTTVFFTFFAHGY